MADRQIQVFGDELADDYLHPAPSRRNGWIALSDALESFADLGSQSVVICSADPYPHLDWTTLANYWRDLLSRPHQLSQLREAELLDWDVTIKTPSTRLATTILASVEYRGRAKPRPVVDPWD